MNQKGPKRRAGRPAKTTTTSHKKRNDEAGDSGNAGKPQTTTRRAAGMPVVTSGSRPTQRRARGSPTPQTKPAITPKATIALIHQRTKVAQTTVIEVLSCLREIASDQLMKVGMFTFPEVGWRVVREPLPQTGRATNYKPKLTDAEEMGEGETEFRLRGVPLKRLLVSAHAVRVD